MISANGQAFQAHQWLDGDSSLGSTAKVLYTDAPHWTFTTGATSTNSGSGRRG
jgi:hypothetical protein